MTVRHQYNPRAGSGMRCAKGTLYTGTGFSSFSLFYYEAFAELLQILSKKFFPETESAIDELLSFQVDV
jgi:hypothetical protein